MTRHRVDPGCAQMHMTRDGSATAGKLHLARTFIRFWTQVWEIIGVQSIIDVAGEGPFCAQGSDDDAVFVV